jgi:hypothetical protein
MMPGWLKSIGLRRGGDAVALDCVALMEQEMREAG